MTEAFHQALAALAHAHVRAGALVAARVAQDPWPVFRDGPQRIGEALQLHFAAHAERTVQPADGDHPFGNQPLADGRCVHGIEGPQEAIRAIVTALGLAFNTRLVSSYVDIFDAVCATYKLPVTDITFEAFRSCTIDLHACQLR